MCQEVKLQEARYAGASWGVKGNKFYADMSYAGFGLQKDRVLFGSRVWAEAHLVGQGKVYFGGSEFCLSDHFGVLAYVDVGKLYASAAKRDVVTARERRGQLRKLKDETEQKELVWVRAMAQAGREELAAARRRLSEGERAVYEQAQQRGARQRRRRRGELQTAAFGETGLFGAAVVATPALAPYRVPCAPTEVGIRGLEEVPEGSWETTVDVPLRGLRRFGNTCYVLSVSQVLMRVPAMRAWVEKHRAQGCGGAHTSCVVCGVGLTLEQLPDPLGGARRPEVAQRRRYVNRAFAGDGQQGAVEFLEGLLASAREQ